MKKLLNIIMLALLAIGLSGGAFAAEKGSPDEAIALVKKAIAYVKANGSGRIQQPDWPVQGPRLVSGGP
jgi:uncharacterized protein YxeA